MNDAAATGAVPAHLPEVLAAVASDELAGARRRVFRQLLEALTYEGILPVEERPDGQGLAFRTTGGGGATYTWRARRRHSFGRLQVDPRSIERHAGGRGEEASSPALFVHELAGALGADPGKAVAFADELSRTVLNDAVGACRRRASNPPVDGYDALEAAAGGHPYHPSYKSRVGFDPLDNLRYGPESAPIVRPVWLAARREAVQVAAAPGTDASALLAGEVGDDVLLRLAAAVADAGGDPQAYVPVPAHPWQYRKRLLPGLVDDVRDATLVPLGGGGDDYRPQQSIRTLANVTTPEKASLKLSLSIVNTSTARTLAPHTVANAPRITGWLRGIVEADPYLGDELRPVLLGEVLGVSYHSPSRITTGDELAAIWRESVHAHLGAGEAAVPFTALSLLDGRGTPVVAPWLAERGAQAWARQLLEVTVPPVLHLLCAHGVAVEAHAQNMVLVHRDGWPVRIALKDFHDGVRFARHLLAHPQAAPELVPVPEAHLQANRTSYLEAEHGDEVRDFLHDAFFFVNLAEVAMFLDDHCGLAERRFWALARDVVLAHRRRFPDLADRFHRFDVLAPTVQVEQLAARRLLPETRPRLHEVPNPLAGRGAE